MIRINAQDLRCKVQSEDCDEKGVHVFVDPFEEEMNDVVEYRLGCHGCWHHELYES